MSDVVAQCITQAALALAREVQRLGIDQREEVAPLFQVPPELTHLEQREALKSLARWASLLVSAYNESVNTAIMNMGALEGQNREITRSVLETSRCLEDSRSEYSAFKDTIKSEMRQLQELYGMRVYEVQVENNRLQDELEQLRCQLGELERRISVMADNEKALKRQLEEATQSLSNSTQETEALRQKSSLLEEQQALYRRYKLTRPLSNTNERLSDIKLGYLQAADASRMSQSVFERSHHK